jgi:hypothetical protein
MTFCETADSSSSSPCYLFQIKGLCGDFDDDQNSDFYLPGGGFTQDAATFAKAYNLNKDCPEKALSYGDACLTKGIEYRQQALTLCAQLKTSKCLMHSNKF